MDRKSFKAYADCDWEHSDAWEGNAANDFHSLPEQSDEQSAIIEHAAQILDSDPASGFGLFVEAAEAGSVYSMERVGWHYWTGTGVMADTSLALEYYRRAVAGGSWTATIAYARLLFELGRHDEWQTVLQDSVEAGFVPAYFWLAWLRYLQAKTPESRREIRPLLEHAARQGHPAAKFFLSRWMARGQLGLLNVPRGWKWVVQDAVDFASRHA